MQIHLQSQTFIDKKGLIFGDTVDMQEILQIENKKALKSLEKQFEHDPDFIEMKEHFKEHPELKDDYIKNLAAKRLISNFVIDPACTFSDEHTMVSQHTSKANQDFSDLKSNFTKGSYYSGSVRNGRYRQDLDDDQRKEYYKNLKVIKRLQQEKKKREKVLLYFENKQIEKVRHQEFVETEEKKKVSEERRKEIQEWRDKQNLKNKERRMLRTKHLKESERKLQELRSLEPLHEKYEKKYMTEVELPELEKRQKILQDISLQNKSDLQNIGQHSVEYEKLRKQKLQERLQKRMDQIKSYSNYNVAQFKTKTFEMMSMRDEMQQSIEEEKRQERIKLIQNRKHYAQNVLELHKPSISNKKQEEMRNLIDNLHKSPQQKVARIKYDRDNSLIKYGNAKTINGRMSRMKNDEDGKLMSNLSSISKIDDSIAGADNENRQDLLDSISHKEGEELDIVPEKVAKYESALNPPSEYKTRSKTMLRRKSRKPNNTNSINHSIDSNKHTFLKFDYLSDQRQKRMEEDGYKYRENDFWKNDISNPQKSSIDK